MEMTVLCKCIICILVYFRIMAVILSAVGSKGRLSDFFLI